MKRLMLVALGTTALVCSLSGNSSANDFDPGTYVFDAVQGRWVPPNAFGRPGSTTADFIRLQEHWNRIARRVHTSYPTVQQQAYQPVQQPASQLYWNGSHWFSWNGYQWLYWNGYQWAVCQ